VQRRHGDRDADWGKDKETRALGRAFKRKACTKLLGIPKPAHEKGENTEFSAGNIEEQIVSKERRRGVGKKKMRKESSKKM